MHAPATLLALLASVAVSVSGHGVITGVSGANGANGQGFGLIAGTPRDTALPVRVVEADTSIMRDREINNGEVSGCGRTKGGGPVDVASEMKAASANGLPSASADGSVTMTLHQVNQDGAGPYACDVSADGTATSFQEMQVTQNVPGRAGLSLAAAKDFPLTAQMPAGVQCTGGPNGDACIVRCRNSAIAGPFGSCVAVTNNNGGNGTAAGTATGTAAAGAGNSNTNTNANADSTNTGSANAEAVNTGNVGTTNGANTASNSGNNAEEVGSQRQRGTQKRYISSRVLGRGTPAWI